MFIIKSFGSHPNINCDTITDVVIIIGFLYFIKNAFIYLNLYPDNFFVFNTSHNKASAEVGWFLFFNAKACTYPKGLHIVFHNLQEHNLFS